MPFDNMDINTNTSLTLAFKRFITNLAESIPGVDALVLGRCAQEVSAALNNGGSLLRIEDFDNNELLQTIQRATEAAPEIVGNGSRENPSLLVYDKEALTVSLYRYHRAECDLAQLVNMRIDYPKNDIHPADILKLFPEAAHKVDWQAIATAAAVRNNLTVITGGPGTGKTHTVAQIIYALAERESRDKILLAAPTGRAANRLNKSLERDSKLKDILAHHEPTLSPAMTVHRLLGYSNGKFMRNKNNPLMARTVIIDESSMIDLLTMCAIFEACPQDTRLILLGDPGQLVSVDAGQVLADISTYLSDGDSKKFTPEFAALLKSSGLMSVETMTSEVKCDSFVQLQENWRSQDCSGINILAKTILQGAHPSVLLDGQYQELSLCPATEDELDLHVGRVVEEVMRASSPQEMLAALDRCRIICAVNHGEFSIAAVNTLAEKKLRSMHKAYTGFYPGRPIMIERNDYRLGLMNGDVGICFPENKKDIVYFSDDSMQNLRGIPVEELAHFSTSWALTVHKSQGSEFVEVVLVIPKEDNKVLCRELLYTGVTRARQRLLLIADLEMVDFIVARPSVRNSNLDRRLREK